MKYDCEAVLLGTEKKVSAKGNEYTIVLFGQGAQTQNMILQLSGKIDFELKLYTPYRFCIDYDTQWKRFSCVDIKKVG